MREEKFKLANAELECCAGLPHPLCSPFRMLFASFLPVQLCVSLSAAEWPLFILVPFPLLLLPADLRECPIYYLQ